MGGNATKQWNTERFSKQEYQDVCNYKDTFGDLALSECAVKLRRSRRRYKARTVKQF